MAAIAMIASLVVAATGFAVWRSRRRALARRLMHAVADAMEMLDRDADPAIGSPELLAPSRRLLGKRLAEKAATFARACRTGPSRSAATNRSRAFSLGEALLRDLRDVASGRRHDLVTRS